MSLEEVSETHGGLSAVLNKAFACFYLVIPRGSFPQKSPPPRFWMRSEGSLKFKIVSGGKKGDTQYTNDFKKIKSMCLILYWVVDKIKLSVRILSRF